jgi:hypothetical protein
MKDLTEQEVINLIEAGEERPELDYKADIDLTANKKEKVEIVKDIIAMANSGGGILVGGVHEEPQGFVWSGMPDDSLKAFDSTALNDFVTNYSDPPINTTTRKITIGDEVYGIVIVPAFYSEPHIVIKDYPDVLRVGDILVRSASNNSVRATPTELRKIIDLAVKRRRGALKDLLQGALESTRPTLVGGLSQGESSKPPFDRSEYSDKYIGFSIVKIVPENWESDIRPMSITDVVKNSAINDRNGYSDFPPINLPNAVEKRLPMGIIYQQENEYHPQLSFVFLDIHGQVFCVESVWDYVEAEPKQGGGVGLLSTMQRIFGAILFGRQYYPALGYTGKIRIRYSLESSIPRYLVMESNNYWPFLKQYYNNMDAPIVVERVFTTSMDLAELEAITKDLVSEFFWYFYYDLKDSDVNNFLEDVKQKRIRIPRELKPAP